VGPCVPEPEPEAEEVGPAVVVGIAPAVGRRYVTAAVAVVAGTADGAVRIVAAAAGIVAAAAGIVAAAAGIAAAAVDL